MTRPAALYSLLSTAALSALLAGCAAFNLGPDSDAAREANATMRGYPRLVDVPPEPEDAHCLRAAIAAVNAPAGGRRNAPAGMTAREAAFAAPPTPRPTRRRVQDDDDESEFDNLLDSVRALSRVATGEERETAAREEPEFLAPCPPLPRDEAGRLLAAREYLEQQAQDIRAAAPAPAGGERVTLPADMGAVARPGEGPEAGR